MDLERVRDLARELGCTYSEARPLAKSLRLGIGGIPAFIVRPGTWPAADRILAALWDWGAPFKILGGGSNLMAEDGPLPFGVVHLSRMGGRMLWTESGVEADADVPMPALAVESVRRGLGGLEGMAGVPGTVGGAVIMNAGAFGNDMAAVLEGVALIEPGKGRRWHPASDFAFGYRRSDVSRMGAVAGCRLTFFRDDPALLMARFAEAKARREASQPWRAATAGSVFKNPPGDAAGRLLEALGFKGQRRGAAGFSERHANFLVNHGGALFADAFALCEEARTAAAEAGTTLEYEMEIWR
jgi:UDP-N-acetylmuramate dehydrogenase